VTIPLDRDFVIGACGVVSPSAPAGTSCIELRPRAAHAAFECVRMYVITAQDVRGRPARVAIEQHDGTWNTFTFRDLQVNPSIDASLFSVEPPAGMRPTPASH
jgi:outer membrane lipoprotein-sorting protein